MIRALCRLLRINDESIRTRGRRNGSIAVSFGLLLLLFALVYGVINHHLANRIHAAIDKTMTSINERSDVPLVVLRSMQLQQAAAQDMKKTWIVAPVALAMLGICICTVGLYMIRVQMSFEELPNQSSRQAVFAAG